MENKTENISQLVEAILFFKNEPISVADIASLLEKDVSEIETTVGVLQEIYATRGIRIVRNGDEIMFKTAPEASELITVTTKEELSRDLGKAQLEVLSIILYKQPVSRREIDYIRGVNSSFILRNLLVRGLVEKTETKEGDRSFTYKPTFDLLSYMGLSSISQLPEYEKMKQEIETVKEKESQDANN